MNYRPHAHECPHCGRIRRCHTRKTGCLFPPERAITCRDCERLADRSDVDPLRSETPVPSRPQ